MKNCRRPHALKTRLRFVSCLFLASGSLYSPAWASPDGMAIEVGSGNQTDMMRLAVQWKTNTVWYETENWQLTHFYEASLGRWHGKAYPTVNGQAGTGTQNLTDIGFTPVFRFARAPINGLSSGWYLEGGIGAHYLSDLYDTNRRTFTTRFQFGDHLGVGYVWPFAGGQALDIALHAQHLSNAGIKRPNPGVNFLELKLHYWF